MPHIRYTADELKRLRESPLCTKPPGLPSLDQWIDTTAEQNGRRKQQNTRGDEQATSEGANAARPLFPPRHSQRNNSGKADHDRFKAWLDDVTTDHQAEDIFLGPPGTKFGSSSRTQTRNLDSQEKGADRYNSATFGDDAGDRPSYGTRNRGARDQDDDRPPRDRSANVLGRRANARDADGEGWSTVNRRRSSHNEEGAERWRPGERDRNRNKDNNEAIDDQPRRNGLGRGTRMGAWRDEQAEGEGNRTGTRWRERVTERERDTDRRHDRDHNRERERERDWTRGHKVQDKLDEEPEWMNEPVVRPQEEKRTADDFERWKAERKAKSASASIDNTTKDEATVPMYSKDTKAAAAPKGQLNFASFATFGAKKVEQPEIAPAETMLPLKGLGKSSKFGAFFQKEETPPPMFEPEPPQQQAPPQQIPQQLPQQLLQAMQGPPAHMQPPPQPTSPANGGGSSKEDAEGFQRILQMLGGTKISSPTSQQPPQEGASLASALFPGGMGGDPGQRTSAGSRPDSASLVNELLARHSANRSRGPLTAPAEPDAGSQYFPPPGGEYNRLNGREENVNPRPSGPLFSPTNGTRQRPETPTDQKRDFLLKLIEKSNAGKLPPQANPEFLKQAQLAAVTAKGPAPQQPPQHLPQLHQPEMQQRVVPSAPPGLPDALFGRGMPEHDPRKTMGRPPNGPGPGALPHFFDDGPHDPAILGMPGLARRNTSDHAPQPRQPPVSNMGIPSQNAPAIDHHPGFPPRGPPPQGAPQQQNDIPQQRGMAPPPGFSMPPRPPPGFQPQPPHLQSPNGLPPHQGQHMNFGGRAPPPPGMFGPPPQGMPGPPHGFFSPPPPGFGPPQGMGPGPEGFFMGPQGQGGRGRGGPPFM